MCAGAIVQARIVYIFGTRNPKWLLGAQLLIFSMNQNLIIKLKLLKEFAKKECSKILKDFFEIENKG